MAKTIEEAQAEEWKRYHAPPLRRLTEHERDNLFANEVRKDPSIAVDLLPDWFIKELYAKQQTKE